MFSKNNRTEYMKQGRAGHFGLTREQKAQTVAQRAAVLMLRAARHKRAVTRAATTSVVNLAYFRRLAHARKMQTKALKRQAAEGLR